MFMIFDTETSGFVSLKVDHSSPASGRIVQLSALLLDESFNEVSFFHSLIDVPAHVKIYEGAFAQHGISIYDCKRFGIPIEAAIILLDSYRAKSKYQIGHNIKFDIRAIHYEEIGIFGQPRLECTNPISTMEETVDICKIPFKDEKEHFGQKYKGPKLCEAYQHLFKETMQDAHSALGDVRATARIFKYLWQEGFLSKYQQVESS